MRQYPEGIPRNASRRRNGRNRRVVITKNPGQRERVIISDSDREMLNLGMGLSEERKKQLSKSQTRERLERGVEIVKDKYGITYLQGLSQGEKKEMVKLAMAKKGSSPKPKTKKQPTPSNLPLPKPEPTPPKKERTKFSTKEYYSRL